jgi:hypothetical protein
VFLTTVSSNRTKTKTNKNTKHLHNNDDISQPTALTI